MSNIQKPQLRYENLDPAGTSAWQNLYGMAANYQSQLNLHAAFTSDTSRFERLTLRAPHMLIDLSKNLWDAEVLNELLELANQMKLDSQRSRLLSGKVVNHSEQQAAVHAALRQAFCADDSNNNTSAMVAHCQDLEVMLTLSEEIRANAEIKDIVHIGIGGSGLGPELAVQALEPFKNSHQRFHFVSNLDGHDLASTLKACQPANTMVFAASKSWSTAETMLNLHAAIEWLIDGGQSVADRVIAVTANLHAPASQGIQHVLRMPSDMGGRYSLWCAVGLPLAVAIGEKGFKRVLQGAAQMDAHFAQAPNAQNAAVWLGLLDVWYSSFLRLHSKCIVPYHHGLRRFPAYLQQLEMESNGKRVRQCGTPTQYPTGMAVWGEPGTNGQHAFFQWLHQGTSTVPIEFLAAKKSQHPWPAHQNALLGNAVAQAQALMVGGPAPAGGLPGHQDFPGNRPSTFFLLDDLSPESFGALLALHEHRVFVSGVVWGVNSFDQWGVELGKRLAKDIKNRLQTGCFKGLDASTQGLLKSMFFTAKS